MEKKFIYRYEAVEYAAIDWDGEYVTPRYPNPKIELIEYEVKRETPKGYWLERMFPKWIRKDAKKAYARPTKEQALHDFIERYKHRVRILKRQLLCSEIALDLAKDMALLEKKIEEDTF